MDHDTARGSSDTAGTRVLLSPTQLAAHYGLGLTRVYEECRREDGLLHDVCVRWGRRILIPAAAAARIFEGEGGELDD